MSIALSAPPDRLVVEPSRIPLMTSSALERPCESMYSSGTSTLTLESKVTIEKRSECLRPARLTSSSSVCFMSLILGPLMLPERSMQATRSIAGRLLSSSGAGGARTDSIARTDCSVRCVSAAFSHCAVIVRRCAFTSEERLGTIAVATGTPTTASTFALGALTFAVGIRDRLLPIGERLLVGTGMGSDRFVQSLPFHGEATSSFMATPAKGT